ncbi:MAG: hypothetical protein KUG77_03840 [Nannocystaceae bacterium]|nr:hypothetical protein [Nannocystaceae bacterium]
MSRRAGRWRIETARSITLSRIEVTVDGVAVYEAPVPSESVAPRHELLERASKGPPLDVAERGSMLLGTTGQAEVVACGPVRDGVCVVARRGFGSSGTAGLSPSALVSSYEVAERVPDGSSALWLRSGALLGARGTTEEVTGVWSVEGLTGELSLEMQTVAIPEPAELAASVEAMQGIEDLDDHGIEISVLGLGEATVAGLPGEMLRYRMRAPDGDVYQAIWSFAGTPGSISEPYARLELETAASEWLLAEAFWTELVEGVGRDGSD